METRKWAVTAIALTSLLAVAGCRGNSGGSGSAGGGSGDGSTSGSQSAGGASTTPMDTTNQQQPQSGQSADQSGVYQVGSMESGEVILRQRGTNGEMEQQSGKELRVKKDEFQRLAGQEAKEGDVVHVQTGTDGKPTAIHMQSGNMEKSGSGNGMGSGSGSGSGSGTEGGSSGSGSGSGSGSSDPGSNGQ